MSDIMVYTSQARSQDFQKGGYMDVLMVCMHAFAKQADFEFPREKVLRLGEQQVG